MTGQSLTIEDLISQLAENSRTELTLVRTLSDAIRRVDDQMLRELRSLTLQHELRRETIFGELQTLAGRLCSLPTRQLPPAERPMIEQHTFAAAAEAADIAAPPTQGADWRQAASNIDDEFAFAFQPPPVPMPRH